MIEQKLNPPFSKRRTPEIRRAEIIDAALRLAKYSGVQGLIRKHIAEEAGISGALLYKYFGNMDILRDEVIKTAFIRNEYDVLYKSLSIDDFKKLNTCPRLSKHLAAYVKI